MTYESILENRKRDLIRKAKRGGAFVAPRTATPIESITEFVGGAVKLKALPAEYEGLGHLTADGMQFAREVSQSEISSFGSTTPTRTDITADSTTLTVVAQETKLLTIGLATGADLAAIKGDATTGEVRIAKPATPQSRSYRVLSIAVDDSEYGEIYIARFLPNAKVTNYAEQSLSNGDEAIPWGVTWTSERDDVLGTSEVQMFGGPGWLALLDEMGIEQES